MALPERASGALFLLCGHTQEDQEDRQGKKMTRKRLCIGAVRQVLMCAALFFVFYQVFSVVQVFLEYDYQYTDTVSKLEGLEERHNRSVEWVEEKLDIYLDRRQKDLDLVAMLLNENVQEREKLEAYKSVIGLQALAVADAQYRVIGGDAIGELCPDYAARLAQSWGEESDSFAYFMTEEQNGEHQILFAYQFDDGNLLLGSILMTALGEELQAEFSSLTELKQYTFGDRGFMIGFEPISGRLVYFPADLPVDDDAAALIEKARRGGITPLGADAYQIITHDFADGTRYAAFLSLQDICAKRDKTTTLYAMIFTLGTMLLYWYAGFLREDERRGALICRTERSVLGLRRHSVTLRRMGRMVLTLLVAMAVMSYYLETFTSASGHRINNTQRLNMVEQTAAIRKEEARANARAYDDDLVSMAQLTAMVLQAEPSLCSPEGVTRIANTLGVDSVYVFDREGRTVATNTVFTDFVLSDQPDDQSYAFWNVVRGYDEVCVQEARQDDSAWHREIQYVGVARRDAQGMVQLGVVPDEYRKNLSTPLLSVIGEMPALSDGAFYFIVDENGLVQSWPAEDYNGGAPERLGLTEEELRDGYSGNLWLADRQYFLTCRRLDGQYAFVAIPKSSVFSGDAGVMQSSVLVGAFIIALLALLLVIKRAVCAKLFAGRRSRPEKKEAKRSGFILEAYERFHRKNSGEKLEALIRFFAGLAVVGAFLYYQWMDKHDEADSMLAYVLSKKWDHSLNVFSLTYVLWVVAATYFVAFALCRAIRWFMGIMSTRSRTIGVLLGNVIEYGAAFGALFYCLPLVGFNPAAVVATASFISFALTFGAQELIKDFLSGMFIIFEDSLRVGDRVNIDGSEGYVEEIGLRMTTLVLEDGNAKVIHNSAVNKFTRKLHLAKVRIVLDDPASVETIRRVLLSELHSFRAGIDKVIAEPYLERREEKEGVVLVYAQCRKEDVENVEFELGNMVRRALEYGGVKGWKMIERQ